MVLNTRLLIGFTIVCGVLLVTQRASCASTGSQDPVLPAVPYTVYWWENAPYANMAAGNDLPPYDVPVQINLTSLSGLFLPVIGGIGQRCGPLLEEAEVRDLTSSRARHVNDDRMWRYVLLPNQLDLLSRFTEDPFALYSRLPEDGDQLPVRRRRPAFFLPFTSRSQTFGLGDHGALWFAPLVESPGAVHFFRKELEPAASDLSDVLIQAWPLLILILLGAAYSGIIIWLLDRLKNPTDFPKPFIPGFWEGFWWAFVTMTTVGYGDTTPRSLQARVFGLVWIVVGVTLLSVFTATVTSVLTKSSLIHHKSLQGIEVAVLNGSEEHSLAISMGAKVIVMNSFEELVASMDNKISKSAIVDQFVFAVNQDTLQDNYLLDEIYQYPVLHGLVIRDASLALRRCIMTYLAENRLHHLTKLSTHVPPLKVRTVQAMKGAQDLFRPETVIYMFYGLAVWAVIFVGFIFWHFLYWAPKHCRRQEMKRTLAKGNPEQPCANGTIQTLKPDAITNKNVMKRQFKKRARKRDKGSSNTSKAFQFNAHYTRRMAAYMNNGFDGMHTSSRIVSEKVKEEGSVCSKVKGEGSASPKVKGEGNASPKVKGEGNASPKVKGEGNASPKVKGNASPKVKGEGNASPKVKLEGNASPNVKGEGNASHNVKGEGNACPNVKGEGNASPKVKGDGNASPKVKGEGNTSPSLPEQIAQDPRLQPILDCQYTEIETFKEEFLRFKKDWVERLTEAKARHRRELQTALKVGPRKSRIGKTMGPEVDIHTSCLNLNTDFTLA